MVAARQARILAAAGATLVMLAVGADQARAADQIEGSWFFEDGEVLVEPTGTGTFKGTVVKPTRFTTCAHPAGQRMWEINGSGASYTGTHIWFTSSCGLEPGGQVHLEDHQHRPGQLHGPLLHDQPGPGVHRPSTRPATPPGARAATTSSASSRHSPRRRSRPSSPCRRQPRSAVAGATSASACARPRPIHSSARPSPSTAGACRRSAADASPRRSTCAGCRRGATP